MSESDIKLRLIRLIDSQEGEKLEQLYDLILGQLFRGKHGENPQTDIEIGYEEMSKDREREVAAIEWIEGTLQSENL